MTKAPATPKAKPNDEEVFLRRVRPDLWQNPVPQDVYDFAIIGAGPAGIAAAESAARLGARVALIERNRIGGNSPQRWFRALQGDHQDRPRLRRDA